MAKMIRTTTTKLTYPISAGLSHDDTHNEILLAGVAIGREVERSRLPEAVSVTISYDPDYLRDEIVAVFPEETSEEELPKLRRKLPLRPPAPEPTTPGNDPLEHDAPLGA